MNNNYTAQAILAMATRDETRALEHYFGPQWVYRVLRDEDTKPRDGLHAQSIITETRDSKNAAREAWESIKRDIDKMAALGLTQEPEEDPNPEVALQEQDDEDQLQICPECGCQH